MLATPFEIQITGLEGDNARKTMDLQVKYMWEPAKGIRSQLIKLLHSARWETLEESIVNKYHWWPPVSDEIRSTKGTWMTHYTRDTKLVKVILSLDWRAYEGNAEEPQIEWKIDTPTSEYHPGVHRGLFLCQSNNQRIIRLSRPCRFEIPHLLTLRTRSRQMQR